MRRPELLELLVAVSDEQLVWRGLFPKRLFDHGDISVAFHHDACQVIKLELQVLWHSPLPFVAEVDCPILVATGLLLVPLRSVGGSGLYDARKRTRLNAAKPCGCQIPQVFVIVTGVTDGWRHFLLIR